jgi:hypothetical protein
MQTPLRGLKEIHNRQQGLCQGQKGLRCQEGLSFSVAQNMLYTVLEYRSPKTDVPLKHAACIVFLLFPILLQ